MSQYKLNKATVPSCLWLMIFLTSVNREMYFKKQILIKSVQSITGKIYILYSDIWNSGRAWMIQDLEIQDWLWVEWPSAKVLAAILGIAMFLQVGQDILRWASLEEEEVLEAGLLTAPSCLQHLLGQCKGIYMFALGFLPLFLDALLLWHHEGYLYHRVFDPEIFDPEISEIVMLPMWQPLLWTAWLLLLKVDGA